MTTRPRLLKYRIRRSTPLLEPARDSAGVPRPPLQAPGAGAGPADRPSAPAGSAPPAESVAAREGEPRGLTAGPGEAAAPATPPEEMGPTDPLETIRQEGLTPRQLRMARRTAQKHGIEVASDFDAVRQLRRRGIDPFARSTLLQIVPNDAAPAGPGANLPQTVPAGTPNLPSTERLSPAERRAGEIMRIQKDLARRRRRRSALLGLRLSLFVALPTALAGFYFYEVATPMYATESEFVIQQAEATGAAGLGGLFQGTSMATQQDSMTVQSYLTSRAALGRLDDEFGFRDAFSDESVDPIQRLPADASAEETYEVYQDHVRISYDPTEGIIKMEVVAPDPAQSQLWSEALIGYAEEQVDQLTQRLRASQMEDALASYEAAEARRAEALSDWLAIQQSVQQIDPAGETAARTQQISALETERQQLQLSLQERLSVPRPNEAQVANLQTQIDNIGTLIANLRDQMTAGTGADTSLAASNTELRLAEEDYTFQTLLVQQALQQMETARIEANRQVRYLSLGVEPVAPDEPTYPRAFENTLLAFCVFAGLYLMLSLTASILREQVSA